MTYKPQTKTETKQKQLNAWVASHKALF